MIEPKKILLQTTIPTAEDEWSISRFSSLAALLRDARNESGTLVSPPTPPECANGAVTGAASSRLHGYAFQDRN